MVSCLKEAWRYDSIVFSFCFSSVDIIILSLAILAWLSFILHSASHSLTIPNASYGLRPFVCGYWRLSFSDNHC